MLILWLMAAQLRLCLGNILSCLAHVMRFAEVKCVLQKVKGVLLCHGDLLMSSTTNDYHLPAKCPVHARHVSLSITACLQIA